jgi:hypothetical protein
MVVLMMSYYVAAGRDGKTSRKANQARGVSRAVLLLLLLLRRFEDGSIWRSSRSMS